MTDQYALQAIRELSQNVSASIPIVAWSIRNIADPGF